MEFNSGRNKVEPLHHFSFQVADGELVVLVGPSGRGELTLLSCPGRTALADERFHRLRRDRGDRAHRSGTWSQYRRQTVGVVFQAFNLIPSLTARSQRDGPPAGWPGHAA